MFGQSQSTTAWLDRHIDYAVPEAGKRQASRMQQLSHHRTLAARITFARVTVPLRLPAEIGVARDAACCFRSNHNLNRMTGRSDQ